MINRSKSRKSLVLILLIILILILLLIFILRTNMSKNKVWVPRVLTGSLSLVRIRTKQARAQ